MSRHSEFGNRSKLGDRAGRQVEDRGIGGEKEGDRRLDRGARGKIVRGPRAIGFGSRPKGQYRYRASRAACPARSFTLLPLFPSPSS